MKLSEMLASKPPVRVIPDAPALFKNGLITSGYHMAVIDDDPTGVQTVHDVSVYMRWCTKSGLDPKVLYEAIRNGWAGSKVLDVSADAILTRNFKPGGTVNIHWKDLGYALQLAKEQDVPLPATALAHEIFKTARASGRGQLSQPSIINLWEDLLKIVVK